MCQQQQHWQKASNQQKRGPTTGQTKHTQHVANTRFIAYQIKAPLLPQAPPPLHIPSTCSTLKGFDMVVLLDIYDAGRQILLGCNDNSGRYVQFMLWRISPKFSSILLLFWCLMLDALLCRVLQRTMSLARSFLYPASNHYRVRAIIVTYCYSSWLNDTARVQVRTRPFHSSKQWEQAV